MKAIRMKEEYVNWIKNGIKHATTRTTFKGFGQFQVYSGSQSKPKKTGIIIDVVFIYPWRLANLPFTTQLWLAQLEGFCNFKEFWEALQSIYRGKVDNNTIFYTHVFEVVRI